MSRWTVPPGSRAATRCKRRRAGRASQCARARPAVLARVYALQRARAGRGIPQSEAPGMAARIIDGQLRQQAMVLSFERLFYLAGIAFLCVLPLVFFLKTP